MVCIQLAMSMFASRKEISPCSEYSDCLARAQGPTVTQSKTGYASACWCVTPLASLFVHQPCALIVLPLVSYTCMHCMSRSAKCTPQRTYRLHRSDHAALVLELRGVPPPAPHAPCAASSARDRRFNDRSQRSVAALFAAGRRKPKAEAAGGQPVREPCVPSPGPAPGGARPGDPAGASSGPARSPNEPGSVPRPGVSATPDAAEPAGCRGDNQSGPQEAALVAGAAAGAGSAGALPPPGVPEVAGGQQRRGLGTPAEASSASAAAGERVGAAANGSSAGTPGAERTSGAAPAQHEAGAPGAQCSGAAGAAGAPAGAGSTSEEEPGRGSGRHGRPGPARGPGRASGALGGGAEGGARARKRSAGPQPKADPKYSTAKKRAASGALAAAGQRSIRSFLGGGGGGSGVKQG